MDISEEKTEEKKVSLLYRLIRWFVWLFSPKYRLEGAEKLPEEPCVLVGNHSQMHGPIAAEFYTPGPHYIWCAGEMLHREEVAAYAYRDFWSGKPRAVRWFYKLLSHLIVPLSVLIFNSAHTIPVYHDTRLLSTFRESIRRLQAGCRIVIFPECYDEHNQIVHEFKRKFVDLARFYYKKTGQALCFVPVYTAPELKKLCYGEPIRFRPEAPIEEERERICRELMDGVTRVAVAQPLHRVVPFPNVSKRNYPYNRPEEGRKPVDYSGFSLRRLNEPRFSHLKLLGTWIFYFTMYFLTENLIPAERCASVHCALDDLIPFHEFFLLFYVGWYFLVLGALLYNLFYNVEGFRRLQLFIFVTQVVAMACYILWPSRQDLRPEVFERENILTALMGFIYAFDTPTGVCPSLHVAYSLGILSVGLKDRWLRRGQKLLLGGFVLMVCVSVCFVKQHSALDVLAALPLCLLAEALVYGRAYWLPRLRSKKTAV